MAGFGAARSAEVEAELMFIVVVSDWEVALSVDLASSTLTNLCARLLNSVIDLTGFPCMSSQRALPGNTLLQNTLYGTLF